MFIETCLLSIGLHAGSNLLKKIKHRKNKTGKKSKQDTETKLQKIVTDLDLVCQTFVRENIDPVFGRTRSRQLKALSPSGEPHGISEEQKLEMPEIENACYKVGYGIRVNLSEHIVRVGSSRFMEMENITIPGNIKAIEKKCGNQGYSLVMIAVDNELSGAVELCPVVRSKTKQLISSLHQKNISTYIISGDHKQPTKTLAKELGINHYYANSLPEQKAEIIEQLQEKGKIVCFIGDGINDSIALKKADVSISLRGAATAAIDSAQIVLMNENLNSLIQLLDISKKYDINQKSNLMISLIPGVICIGGVFLFHFGIYTVMLLYYSGIGAGIGNATLPLIDYRNTPG